MRNQWATHRTLAKSKSRNHRLRHVVLDVDSLVLRSAQFRDSTSDANDAAYRTDSDGNFCQKHFIPSDHTALEILLSAAERRLRIPATEAWETFQGHGFQHDVLFSLFRFGLRGYLETD